jgi:protein-S-isoprenylcysteine O-methyltransferase Ste14
MANDHELFFRQVVVSASGIIYWAGVLIQARRVRRHIGRSPNLKPMGLKERLLWLGWFIVILAWVIQPVLLSTSPAWPGLRLCNSLLTRVTFVCGLALVLAGYAGTLWCYRAMGDSWRIGVNRKEKNALVVLGPYRRVRHPIYFFQIVMLLGAALLLPTVVSLGILMFHLVCVLIKATDEEAYLLSAHGQPYREYLARTGRLLPKLLVPART